MPSSPPPPPPPTSRHSKGCKRNTGSGSGSSSSSSSSSRRELPFVASKTSAPGQAKDLTVREKFSDHKENTSSVSMGSGRHSHNLLQTPPKKPWAPHFSKVSITSSPNPRILGERNRSCSPSRSGSPKVRTDPSEKDEKQKLQSIVASPLEQKPHEGFTPKGKSVAELSKRIQKFLVDQESQLGITPAVNDVETMAVADVERIQANLSSPYDPYSSPFSERPRFLHLHGTIPAMDTLELQTNNILMGSQLEKEITHEGERPKTDFVEEIEEGEIVEENAGKLSLPEEVPLLLSGGREGEILKEFNILIVEETQTESVEEVPSNQLRDPGIPLLMQKEELPCEDEKESRQENEEPPVQEAVRTDEAQMEDLDDNYVSGGTDDVQNIEESVDVVPSVDYDEFPEVELHKERSYTKDIVFSVLLLSFLLSVLIASGSSGLLLPSFKNNYVSSGWHGSMFRHSSMAFLQSFEALWSKEQTYLAVDVRMVMEDGKSLYRSMKSLIDHKEQIYIRAVEDANNLQNLMKTLFEQATHEINLQLELASHSAMQWWQKFIYSEVLDERTRQFEWMKEYNLKNDGWMNEEEIPQSDWELLHEFDLQEANRLFQRSVSDGVWNDIRNNVTGLSDSAAVKGVLEGLMNLKGGRSEEDRMEVLQYFWEYARSSVSIGEEDLSKVEQYVQPLEEQALEEDLLLEAEESDNIIDLVSALSRSEEGVSEFNEPSEISSSTPGNQKHGTLAVIEAQNDFSDFTMEEEEAHVDFSQQDHLDLVKEDIRFEVLTADIEEVSPTEEDMISTMSLTSDGVIIVSEDVATDNDEMLIKTTNDDWNTSITQLPFSTKSTIAAAIICALTIGATLLILGCKFKLFHRSSAVTAKMALSSVQFLKKTQHQQEERFIMKENNAPEEQHEDNSANELRLDEVEKGSKDELHEREKVTMIEELNGKFASLLRSPVPSSSRQQQNSPHHVREDEDLIRSPLPVSSRTHSPYGSFTTYTLLSKKEGQTVETKLTPVRRSSRLRNQEPPSFQRIAISPP